MTYDGAVSQKQITIFKFNALLCKIYYYVPSISKWLFCYTMSKRKSNLAL